MARYFIKNVKTVEGEGVSAEYDYAGNTRVLAFDERVEVSFDEAQTAIARLRDGLAYEEVSDVVADPVPVVEAAPVVAEAPVVPDPVADVVAEVKPEDKP